MPIEGGCEGRQSDIHRRLRSFLLLLLVACCWPALALCFLLPLSSYACNFLRRPPSPDAFAGARRCDRRLRSLSFSCSRFGSVPPSTGAAASIIFLSAVRGDELAR